MAGPPSKKFKGAVETEDDNDSFDEDEILDGPSERFHEFMSQHTQRIAAVAQAASRPPVAHSTPPTVTLPGRSAATPGQTVLKTTPTSSRTRPSAFPSTSRNSANTPTYGSQNSVSQGEFIAIKFQLGNAQREKDELKYKLAKANEEFNAEKKRLETEKQREIKKVHEKLKMTEGEVQALRMTNASMRAETSMMGADLNESMMSVSSVGTSQRVTMARQTQSIPRLSAGNGFRSDIAATFTHKQTSKMDGETSFQDVPSQAFETPTRIELAPILNRDPSPVQKKVHTGERKTQADLNNETLLELPPFTPYIFSSISTVANSVQLDDELYGLLEKIVKDPSEPDVAEIGESEFSPASSQKE